MDDVLRGLRSVVLTMCLVAPLAGATPAAGGGADDPAFAQGLQWGLDRIGAPGAWSQARGAGVTIAIVDSGADLGHEDFVNEDKTSQIAGHTSCVGSGGTASGCKGSGQDDNGHGTHVAGIAAAATGNSRGVAGVAPDAKLLIVKVLQNEAGCDRREGDCVAEGSPADVAAGIRWAVDHGATVINLSLGNTRQSVFGPSFADAIDDAWARGAVPVVAAGNDFLLPSGFSNEPAIVVAATTRSDTKAEYSNTTGSPVNVVGDARWGVAAPGGEGDADQQSCETKPNGVISTYFDPRYGANQYACVAGTSMAAPHVSGAIAVLLSQGLSPQQAVDRLLATADDIGPKGKDTTFGAGRINLSRAVGTGPTSTTVGGGGGGTGGGGGGGSTGGGGGGGTGGSSGGGTTPSTAPGQPATTVPGVKPGSVLAPELAGGESAGGELTSTGSGPKSASADDPALLVLLAVAGILGSGGATAWWLLRGARRSAPV